MNELRTQTTKVIELLTSPATATTFRDAFSLVWQIIREVGQLLWLVICLGLVFVEWLWKTGYNGGWKTRNWVNNLDQPNTEQIFNETGKSLFEVTKASAAKVVASAKEQLGIEDDNVETTVVTAPASSSTSSQGLEPQKPVANSTPTANSTIVNPLEAQKISAYDPSTVVE
jgi:hypothetical protein